MKMKSNLSGLVFINLLFWATILTLYAQKDKFKFKDAMKFPAIRYQTISNDGKWVGYSLVPDRGDPKSIILNIENDTKITLERCIEPMFSNNSEWAILTLRPKSFEIENAGKDKPSNGYLLVNLLEQNRMTFEKTTSFAFSEDSRWIAILFKPEKSEEKEDRKNKKIPTGSKLTLIDLTTLNQLDFFNVMEYSFDTLSKYFAYVVSEPTGKSNGLYILKLQGDFTLPAKVDGDSAVLISSLAWNKRTETLAYVKCFERKYSNLDSCSIYEIIPSTYRRTEIIHNEQISSDWYLPYKNKLTWTEDGKRLFFGIKPRMDTTVGKEKIQFSDSTLFDEETILKKSSYTLWHWNDPRIKTNEKDWWDKNKDRLFQCVYNTQTQKYLQLADLTVSNVFFADNPNYTIGYDETPYLKESTWEGPYQDLYLINLNTGEKKLIANRIHEGAHLSPLGKYLVFYKENNWHLYDPRKDTLVNLTGKMKYAFYNEDYDQPSPPPSYGFAGWFENDNAFLLYDKYDIWKFFSEDYGYICQTVVYGRELQHTYRIVNLDKKKQFYRNQDSVLISVFDNASKFYSIYGLQFNILGPEKIIDENKNFKVIQKAKYANRILFSREDFDEYPDLWVANMSFSYKKRLTNHNEDFVSKYEWGTTELVQWVNTRGDTLDGFIIKPYGFDSTKKYPLIVYYYERFSQLAHNFNFPQIGHRPCFQIYNSDGYIFFLPDIKYVIGYPGNSALDCITSGVYKLISRGFIDTTAIGIMGHSWSGYQTAYIITQTKMFAAAVAGAPVGNMTSAYSGIRLESGLARQFQYERFQSRIGGSLWDSLSNYINNSPVFKAQTITTPLLLMFGDEDQAVPWQQGVELYLALRRLGKQVYFLQYHNEPHWPEKYSNRLDYALKVKSFFDAFLKKMPFPEWIKSGENLIIKE